MVILVRGNKGGGGSETKLSDTCVHVYNSFQNAVHILVRYPLTEVVWNTSVND